MNCKQQKLKKNKYLHVADRQDLRYSIKLDILGYLKDNL